MLEGRDFKGKTPKEKVQDIVDITLKTLNTDDDCKRFVDAIKAIIEYHPTQKKYSIEEILELTQAEMRNF